MKKKIHASIVLWKVMKIYAIDGIVYLDSITCGNKNYIFSLCGSLLENLYVGRLLCGESDPLFTHVGGFIYLDVMI